MGSAPSSVRRSMVERNGRRPWPFSSPPWKTYWKSGPMSQEKAPVAAASTSIDATARPSRPVCGRTA